jgi:hypothetical protein
VVRRSAALLAAYAVVLGLFLAAPALPEVADDDASLLVAAALGLTCIAACAAAVVPLARTPLAFVLVLPGAALLMAALDVVDVGAAASPAEALVYSSVGAVFAVALGTPTLALALPVVVAGIDAASVLGGDLADSLTSRAVERGDPLTLEFPDLGNGLAAGRLGLADVVFFAIFAVFARRLGLRPVATVVTMTVTLVAAYAAGLLLDRAMPAIPGIALAYFLVNADRLGPLFRRVGEG